MPFIRDEIPQLIEDLHLGNTDSTLRAINQFNEYGQAYNPGYFNYGSSIPLVQVISSSENNLRPQASKDELQKESSSYSFTSPLPLLIAGNSMPTYAKDQYFAKLPTELPKTWVVHGTLDPKTHIEGARQHVANLEQNGSVKMTEIEHGPHFIALNAPTCFINNAKRFVQQEKTISSSCSDDKSTIGGQQKVKNISKTAAH